MNAPSTKDKRPARQNLGPTGPTKLPKKQQSYAQQHPNPGTAAEQIGPHPTDDPDQKAHRLKRKIDKQR